MDHIIGQIETQQVGFPGREYWYVQGSTGLTLLYYKNRDAMPRIGFELIGQWKFKGWLSDERRAQKSLTHIKCFRAGACQEEEGLKGTEWKGTDICSDGCVWFHSSFHKDDT